MRTFRLTAVAAVAALALSMPIFAAQAKPAVKAAKAETIRGTLEKHGLGKVVPSDEVLKPRRPTGS